MERQKDMKPPGLLKGDDKFLWIAVSIIVLFHLVGLAGFLVAGLTPVFLKIVPWHLLLMFAVILFSHKNIDEKFLLFFLCLFIGGYAVEWIGINRHLLFGHYAYGDTLGVKLLGVPLIIGINWFLLIYSTGVLMQRSRLKNMLLRIIVGSLLLVLLDFLIEPVAGRFDYWHWASNSIPLSNYMCWFFISGFMLVLFERLQFNMQSIIAPMFLLMQFVFFTVLYIAIQI
jgi:putative membrane protein